MICRSRGKTRKHVFQPLAEADVVRFACGGEGIEDRQPLSTGFASGKAASRDDIFWSYRAVSNRWRGGAKTFRLGCLTERKISVFELRDTV